MNHDRFFRCHLLSRSCTFSIFSICFGYTTLGADDLSGETRVIHVCDSIQKTNDTNCDYCFGWVKFWFFKILMLLMRLCCCQYKDIQRIWQMHLQWNEWIFLCDLGVETMIHIPIKGCWGEGPGIIAVWCFFNTTILEDLSSHRIEAFWSLFDSFIDVCIILKVLGKPSSEIFEMRTERDEFVVF